MLMSTLKSIVNWFALIAIVTEPVAEASPMKSTLPLIASRKPDWIETQFAAPAVQPLPVVESIVRV